MADRLTSVAACALFGAVVLLPVTAAASGSGAVTSGPKALGAHQSIRSGDWIALGYSLSVGGSHPADTFHIVNGRATFPVSCQQSFTNPITVAITMPANTVSIPANDGAWYPTDHADQAASYELSAQAPNLCNGATMWLGAGDANGVTYTATLQSTDTSDTVNIQFHAVDANSLGGGNIDCSSSSQNPSGGGQCNSPWSPHVATTAATYTAPTPTPAPTPAPTPKPTPAPTATPAPSATPTASATASGSPSPKPTTAPTSSSSSAPSSSPTSSAHPTSSPSPAPPVTTGSSSVGSGLNGGSTPSSGPVVVINGQGAGHSSAPNSSGGHAAGTSGGSSGGSSGGGSGSGPAPGGVQGVSTAAPAPAAPIAPVAQSVVNNVLGPVPVLVTNIGDALTHAGSIPWNWFIALAVVDALLIVLILVRRRRVRAARPPVSR